MPNTLFFDTETTGLPKYRRASALQQEGNWPDLVSISWSLYEGDTCVKRSSHVIQPAGWTIPEDSVRCHGITQEMAEANGRPLSDVLNEIREDIVRSDNIVAHNMEFDKNVLFNAFAWRTGKDPRKFWKPTMEFCSLQKAKDELKIPGKYPTSKDPYKMPGLDELFVATFNEPAPADAHNAERDVRVLEKIVFARWNELLT